VSDDSHVGRRLCRQYLGSGGVTVSSITGRSEDVISGKVKGTVDRLRGVYEG